MPRNGRFTSSEFDAIGSQLAGSAQDAFYRAAQNSRYDFDGQDYRGTVEDLVQTIRSSSRHLDSTEVERMIQQVRKNF